MRRLRSSRSGVSGSVRSFSTPTRAVTAPASASIDVVPLHGAPGMGGGHLRHDRGRGGQMTRQDGQPLRRALFRPLGVGHRPPGQRPEADLRVHLTDHGAGGPGAPQVLLDVEDARQDREGLFRELAPGAPVVFGGGRLVRRESQRRAAGRGEHRRAPRSELRPRLHVAPSLTAPCSAQADGHVHEGERRRIAPGHVGDPGGDQMGGLARFRQRDRDPARAAAVHPDEVHRGGV